MHSLNDARNHRNDRLDGFNTTTNNLEWNRNRNRNRDIDEKNGYDDGGGGDNVDIVNRMIDDNECMEKFKKTIEDRFVDDLASRNDHHYLDRDRPNPNEKILFDSLNQLILTNRNQFGLMFDERTVDEIVAFFSHHHHRDHRDRFIDTKRLRAIFNDIICLAQRLRSNSVEKCHHHLDHHSKRSKMMLEDGSGVRRKNQSFHIDICGDDDDNDNDYDYDYYDYDDNLHHHNYRDNFESNNHLTLDENENPDDDDEDGDDENSVVIILDENNPNMNSREDYDVFVEDGIQKKIPISFETNKFISENVVLCKHRWQFWFWKSDQHYRRWDLGLQTLAKSFVGHQRLRFILDHLLPVDQVGIFHYRFNHKCISFDRFSIILSHSK